MRLWLRSRLFAFLWSAGVTVIYLSLGYRMDWPTWVLAGIVIILGDAIRKAAE